MLSVCCVGLVCRAALASPVHVSRWCCREGVSKGRLGVHRKGADAVNPAGEGLDWEKLLVRDLTQCSQESETRLGCNNERFGSIFIS